MFTDEPIARTTPSPNPFWPTETVPSVKVGKKRRMTRDLELASEPETEPSMMEVIEGMKSMMVTMQKSIEALAKENRELAEANEAKHDVVLRNMYRQTAAINELVAISRPKAGLLPKGDFSLSPIGTEEELREFDALLGSDSAYKTKVTQEVLRQVEVIAPEGSTIVFRVDSVKIQLRGVDMLAEKEDVAAAVEGKVGEVVPVAGVGPRWNSAEVRILQLPRRAGARDSNGHRAL
uniref:Uncharacterized protein n=1 Tax=Anopheles atroparvus TaxID=41427 RepID=A0A182IJR9_ANOAO